MNDDELVRVAIFDSELKADRAKALLESKGITATVMDPDSGTFGFGLDAVDEFFLIISKNDLDAAEKILAEMDAIEDGVPVQAWTCKCGEEVDEGFGACWSCGGAYEG